MLHSAVLNVMIKAAHRAGRSLKRDLGEVEQLQVSLKGPGNFVTAADRRAEEIVYQELAKARPDYGFLGEEGGVREGTDKTHRWIVDPLDGTTNFLHGIPHFAVSIALERNGAIVAGLTYNPANEELFVAERGKGAFLNDQRIRVAGRRRLGDAIVGCGLPHYGRGDLKASRSEIAAAQQNFAGLRRYGSATLDLAWVAAGRLDAYWERDLSPWDMAAGILLVREAGGFVSDLDGGEAIFAKSQVVAGNETMHRELMRLLREAGREASTTAATA
jgi:myo-inositol-1(or 4)-monophosphatase